MRWFWLFIATLAVLTGVLYTRRVRSEQARQAALQAQAETATPGTAARRSRERSTASQAATDSADTPVTPPQTQAEPTTSEPTSEEPTLEPPAAQESGSMTDPEAQRPPIDKRADLEETAEIAEPSPQAEPKRTFNPGALVDTFNELGQQAPSPESEPIDTALARAAQQAEQETQPQQVTQDEGIEKGEAPAPSFELRGDGSFRIIDANIWVQGAGTNAEPYVLGWDALKSIEHVYDPKKGKDKIPDWLNHLDGKVVSIEGNTLVPVVATTTRELLIMQNPWDGCCIGVPPTPYDAIEVVLNHDVDFGNSAVGFGSVQGTFYLDPYIVDGWVLGLYIIEDAKYRSGEGVVFPEF